MRVSFRGGVLIGLLLLQVTSLFALNPYSSEELETLQEEFIRQINQSNAVIRDPLATDWLNQLSARLTKTADMAPPTFFIVNSPEINAFAGPGGYIGLNTALIVAADSESELASVMAHEMAHVRLNHLYHMIEHQKQMRLPMLASLLASAALGVINPTLASGAMLASLGGFAEHNIHYTRAKEKEADRIGMNILMKANMDPKGMIHFFKKMQLQSRYYYQAHIPAILRTHPLDEDRIAEAENRLPKHHSTFIENTDFYFFRELVRVKSARHPKSLIDYYTKICRASNMACEYGLALVLIRENEFSKALIHLERISSNNLFKMLAIAQVKASLGEDHEAMAILRELKQAYPNDYAILMTEAKILRERGHFESAANVLLKGSRLFPSDLPLCYFYAKVLSENGQKAFAYFTDARCQNLQKRRHEAMRSLREAKSLAKGNHYLLLRIEAMEEMLLEQKKQ